MAFICKTCFEELHKHDAPRLFIPVSYGPCEDCKVYSDCADW